MESLRDHQLLSVFLQLTNKIKIKIKYKTVLGTRLLFNIAHVQF